MKDEIRAAYLKLRREWGSVKPYTRVEKNRKKYSRREKHKNAGSENEQYK